jgi:hypothetical protein
MAYMSQEKKSKIAPKVKKVLQKYGVKGTLAVNNHSTLVLNIKSGKIDFIGNINEVCGKKHYQVSNGFRPITQGYADVNPYWYKDHFDGKALAFLKELIPAMNDGNHDNSDAQIDYFDVGWYIRVNIGKWNKPYILE